MSKLLQFTSEISLVSKLVCVFSLDQSCEYFLSHETDVVSKQFTHEIDLVSKYPHETDLVSKHLLTRSVLCVTGLLTRSI